jgi:hypothetical protein
MIDGIATFDGVLAKMRKSRRSPAQTAALSAAPSLAYASRALTGVRLELASGEASAESCQRISAHLATLDAFLRASVTR